MKRVIFIIICILLTGCSHRDLGDETNDVLLAQYKIYKNKLTRENEYQESSDEFAIKLIVNKMNDENRYDIIIDTPQINMYHLQAIAKIEGDSSNSLPTLGILEEETFSLIPNTVDKTKGIYKGINLSGVTSKDKFNVLIYLTFYSDESSIKKEERFIRLYGNTT